MERYEMDRKKNMVDFFQEHLGYTDEEISEFMENPRNQKILAKAPELLKKTIVFEVIESHGCNTQHKVGDKIYFDGQGNLLTKLCPTRICVFAMGVMEKAIFGAHEMFYAGLDPNEMLFKRGGCADIGLKCGGWGKIILEFKMEDRK
jgi:uncharacterized repeat protein (TIGR04076 family)